MGLFNDLMSKIFQHATASQASAGSSTAAASQSGAAVSSPGASGAGATPPSATPASATASSSPAGGSSPAGATPAKNVDVASTLDALAKKNPEKLDWKSSIVDLMKLVGMDSSLSARKELAKDLHYSGDTANSAEMNTWLHQEVMKQLAANGAKIPQDLLNK